MFLKRSSFLMGAMTSAALVASGCTPKVIEPTVPQIKEIVTTLESVGLDSQTMDKTVKPCDDFYQYACGNWMKTMTMPDDEFRWTRSFSEIDKRNESFIKEMMEAAAKEPGEDANLKKIGTFYAACMDEASIETAGIKPIEKHLAVIKTIKDKNTLAAAIIEFHKNALQLLFRYGAEQDYNDATKMNLTLDQGGIGLPNKEYYTNTDEKSKETRAKYLAHVEKMLILGGMKPADAKSAASDVLALETKLANISQSPVDRRDPDKMYNKIDRDVLELTVTNVNWGNYLKALGIPSVKDISVTSMMFFEGLDKLIVSEKASVWRNYFQWHVLRSNSALLPKAFGDESFAFRQILTGQKSQKDRWKRCVDYTSGALAELVAQPYVAKMFGGQSKQAAEQMISSIRSEFEKNLPSTEWMDEATRTKAIEKSQKMAFHIGYPAVWREYTYEIKANSFFENVMASAQFDQTRDLNKIGKPINREDWLMAPQDVNAYYNGQMNEMVFPAGILQPPFFSEKAGVAVNLGAIGIVVGHELTHGFDDEGSKFDAVGNKSPWWEESIRKGFDEKTQCIEKQYSEYEPVPGNKINGKLTLGENIADNGGLKFAYRAYKALRKDTTERIVADGYTEDQQFFLSFAQSWCTIIRDEAAIMQVKTDPHSASRFRINGPTSNSPEFAAAFSCAPTDPMVRAQQCKVW